MAERRLLKPLAISIGDPTGIGPEILLSSLNEIGPSVIFAPKYLRPEQLPEGCRWEITAGDIQSPGSPSIESGRQAYESFACAAEAVQKGSCSALVTLPLSKEHVSLSQKDFRGHTETLGAWWSGSPLMLLMGGALKVGLVTHHIGLKDVAHQLTEEKIVENGEILRREIKRYWTLDREPQLNLLSLNPHAGEGGVLGHEEREIIEPALDRLIQRGGLWKGPHSSDSFFARGQYGDGVLALYHDQGLIPVKMLAQGAGVNVTLGLKHLRVSPDHGTAFDIAGKGQADSHAFLAAVQQVRAMLKTHESARVAHLSA